MACGCGKMCRKHPHLASAQANIADTARQRSPPLPMRPFPFGSRIFNGLLPLLSLRAGQPAAVAVAGAARLIHLAVLQSMSAVSARLGPMRPSACSCATWGTAVNAACAQLLASHCFFGATKCLFHGTSCVHQQTPKWECPKIGAIFSDLPKRTIFRGNARLGQPV